MKGCDLCIYLCIDLYSKAFSKKQFLKLILKTVFLKKYHKIKLILNYFMVSVKL